MKSGTRMHMHLSVRDAIKWPKSQLRTLFKEDETGRQLTAEEAREYLLDLLSEGKELIPLGKCENFDYKKGCLGHPAEEAKQ